VTDDIRVNVLGKVELAVGGAPVPLGDIATRLLALLALAPATGISARDLMAEVWPGRGAADRKNNLEQAVRRLRRSGLGHDHLPPERAGSYRLELRTDQVDVRALLAVADQLDSGDSPSVADIEGALRLWGGDPAAGTGISSRFCDRARSARRRLEAELRKLTRPRILILDDKVGHEIGAILGDYKCTVLTRIEDFWTVAEQLDDRFDAALVDLHLTETDVGAEGLAAVDALRKRSSVPTILMSYRPVEGPVDELLRRYNLFSFFVKSDNAPGGSFTKLRPLVEELLGDGTADVLRWRLYEDLGRLEGRARMSLRRRGEGSIAKEHMQHDVDKIRDEIRATGTLASVRAAVAEFTGKWLPEDT
jgi:DNA-binding response OmpR family regulator